MFAGPDVQAALAEDVAAVMEDEHPNRKPAWPALDQFFARVAPPSLRGSAALGSLRSPSLRLTPEGWRRREERQITERLLHPQQLAPRRFRTVGNYEGSTVFCFLLACSNLPIMLVLNRWQAFRTVPREAIILLRLTQPSCAFRAAAGRRFRRFATGCTSEPDRER